jgi:hypothetical protein
MTCDSKIHASMTSSLAQRTDGKVYSHFLLILVRLVYEYRQDARTILMATIYNNVYPSYAQLGCEMEKRSSLASIDA